MDRQFEGKVILVTGGSSGIGRATALAFAKRGGKVIIGDVDIEGGGQTVRMIDDGGGKALFAKTDASKAADVEALVNQAAATYGRLDYAFNNAGVGTGHPALTADFTEEYWDRVLSINLKGIWLCMKYEIRQMLKQGGGAIVNTSSAAGLVAIAGRSAYVSSKHAVVGLTKTAALDYADKGIRINAICPSFIRTPMVESAIRNSPQPSLAETQLIGLVPMRRIGSPEEVAEAVVWLCSDAASFITGHSLAIDGGYVIP
jgi:NAD(P)-dependent dehydrogenase (short-subunit alcohol dehydrogenase family)